jgi:hypothetical protein
VSSTDLNNPTSIPLPHRERGFETLIFFRPKRRIFLPLSASERGWGEVHRTHVFLSNRIVSRQNEFWRLTQKADSAALASIFKSRLNNQRFCTPSKLNQLSVNSQQSSLY